MGPSSRLLGIVLMLGITSTACWLMSSASRRSALRLRGTVKAPPLARTNSLSETSATINQSLHSQHSPTPIVHKPSAYPTSTRKFSSNSSSSGGTSDNSGGKEGGAMPTVQRMTVQQFHSILQNPDIRSLYQIVDVREQSELEIVSIPAAAGSAASDIIHLPLSTASTWSQQIERGEHALDSEKPTLCLCHHGIRSMQMASFLVSRAGFEDVANIEGGIDAYAEHCDPSIGTY